MIKDKGLSIFMTKTAEAEPWLVQHAFVPPSEFEFFKGLHSNIIYARSGTGKTAIRCALAEYARNELKCLPVKWTPDLTANSQSPSTELALAQFSTVLTACAHEILVTLPKDFKKRAKDNRNVDFMVEFLHHFAHKEDQELLENLLPVSKSFLIGRDTKLESIATELIKSMKHVDLPGGIWVLVDGLNWNSEAQKETAINLLQSVLSTLQLFEISGFYFKMFFPMELERELVETSAIKKERATPSRISWGSKQLRVVIEKRLRLALGDEQIQVEQIHPADELFKWLEECGGMSPRGWLEYFRPIFATVWENYLSEGLHKLTEDEWVTARKRSSLQLKFSPASSEVAIGMNSPRMLSQEELAIFSYLHQNEGRYCSKRELYNKAYLPFNTKGQGRELGPNDELTKEYDDLVNTAINRLRKKIEPLPKDPVFLTMKKNIGYRLSLQAFLD